MATIHSLNTSISQMTFDEAILLVRDIRRKRYIIPERRREVVSNKKVAKAKANTITINALESMSKEDREALIKMLEEQE